MSGYKYYDDDYTSSGKKFGDRSTPEVKFSSEVKYDIDKFIVFENTSFGQVEQVSIGLNTYEEAKSFIDNHTNRTGSDLFIMATIKEKK